MLVRLNSRMTQIARLYACVIQSISSHCHLSPWRQAVKPTSARHHQLSKGNLLNKRPPISGWCPEGSLEECGSFNEQLGYPPK